MNTDLSEELIQKFDSKQLSEFLGEQGVKKSGVKGIKILTLLENVSSGKIIMEDFQNFIISQIKFSTNRIIINAPLNVNMESTFYQKELLTNYIVEKEEITEDEVCFNSILDANLSSNFKLIYREILDNVGVVSTISLCYARNIEILRVRDGEEISDKKNEYIWIDIFPEEEFIRIHLADNPKNITSDIQSSAYSIFNYFRKILMKDYQLTLGSQNEEGTLYKLYKYLTNKFEAPYVQEVEPQNNKITEFVNEVCTDLDYTINKADLDIEKRVIKLFERALIQRAYEQEPSVDDGIDGKLETFIFVDGTGGSVKTGGNKEITIDECDVYFDTKETVHSVKRLKSVWINWYKVEKSIKVNEAGDEEEIKTIRKINVKYDAYDNFYVTHFIRKNVSKEDYDYVLPKFDEYKEKAL